MKRVLLVLLAALCLAGPAHSQQLVDGKTYNGVSSFWPGGSITDNGNGTFTAHVFKTTAAGALRVALDLIPPVQQTLASGLTVAGRTWFSDSTNTTHGVAFESGNLYSKKYLTITYSGIGASDDSTFIVRAFGSYDLVNYSPVLMRPINSSLGGVNSPQLDTLQWCFKSTSLTGAFDIMGKGDYRAGITVPIADNTGRYLDMPGIKFGVLNRSNSSVTYTLTVTAIP